MDNKNNVGSPDRDRINVHEEYELQYWSKKLGITRQELKDAIKAVGTSAEKVEAYLKK
ncbi:DUF3606 domain-containing protein [Mucilaginibacter terrenus]|uniref:DUF3606 domain-containing protein n=1 Tax=Mucilaginibacter terrenus TaxID=2482727 RepID=A0A3E2NP56_9SPHI|nr:DUF3606 domain-containing protein [Mucilaginibacter terrenus]RFZ82731.1 DUF3606 domain-containing protein [Mucilaginibacter terrenus]